MVEHVAVLTCPAGHAVEVHWAEGEQGEHWQCPQCALEMHQAERLTAITENQHQPDVLRSALREAAKTAHEGSLVGFGNRKKGDRQLPADLALRPHPTPDGA